MEEKNTFAIAAVIIAVAVVCTFVVLIIKKKGAAGDGSTGTSKYILIKLYNSIISKVFDMKENSAKSIDENGNIMPRRVAKINVLQLTQSGFIIARFPVYDLSNGCTISHHMAQKNFEEDIVLKKSRDSSTVSQDAVSISCDDEGFFLQRCDSINAVRVLDNNKLIDIGDKSWSITGRTVICIGKQFIAIEPVDDAYDLGVFKNFI